MDDISFIFDNDGTLINSEHIHKTAEREAVKQFLDLELSADEHSRYTGTKLRQMYTELINRSGKEVDINLMFDLTKKNIISIAESQGLDLIPGVFDFISELRKIGIYKIGVATSGNPEWTEYSLKKTGIHQLFDVIVANNQYKNSKPHPEVFELTAKKLDSKPTRCVAFEDSINGIKAAKLAGMHVYGITTSFSKEELYKAGADSVISRFENSLIPQIMERLN